MTAPLNAKRPGAAPPSYNKRVATACSLSLLDLPNEILLQIVRLLPSRSVHLCCHRLRALSDSAVRELFVINCCQQLSLNAICEKLRACAYSIQRLVLYGVYFTTEHAFERFYSALNACPNLCTLVLPPGTGSDYAVYDFMRAEHVRAVYALPITTGLSTQHRLHDRFQLHTVGDFCMYTYPGEDEERPPVKFASRDAAISARPASDAAGRYRAVYDAWATVDRRLFLPDNSQCIAAGGRNQLMFGSLWFDTYISSTFKTLVLVDTIDNGSARNAVILQALEDECAPVCSLRNVCNLICSFRLRGEELRSIRPVALHTVTLWVRPKDLEYTRAWVGPNVRVVPAPLFSWCCPV